MIHDVAITITTKNPTAYRRRDGNGFNDNMGRQMTATAVCFLIFLAINPHVDGFLVKFPCWRQAAAWRISRWSESNGQRASSTTTQRRGRHQTQPGRSNETSSVTTVVAKTQDSTEPLRRFRNNTKWDIMIHKLRAFRDEHGHSNVPKDFVDRELYTWVRSVRTNYRHQVRSFAQPQQISHASNTRESSPRLQLSPAKLEQLRQLDFVWEVKRSQWHDRYQELCNFQQQHGHTRVPMNNTYPVLGVWAANQRRDYQRLQQGQATKILNDERIRLLQQIDFEWSKSHSDTWQQRYRELQDYVEQYGHANVPEDFPDNVALGQWCMNQRTAYRHLQSMTQRGDATASTATAMTCSMTPERIELLEAVGFSWNVLDTNWWNMLQRLKVHHHAHGHVQIATSDFNNMDLRIWLIVQRHQYRRRQENRTSTMTLSRIRAMEEAIPDFAWKVRGVDSLSTEDWEQLFSAIRAKGIAPGMRPKQHWFEGQDRFETVKDTWTDEDLLALWHQEESNEDS